jgi:hypothetical protein
MPNERNTASRIDALDTLKSTASAPVLAALTCTAPCIECGAVHCEPTAACGYDCSNDHVRAAKIAADECGDFLSYAFLAGMLCAHNRAQGAKAESLLEKLRSGDAFGFARAAVGGAK